MIDPFVLGSKDENDVRAAGIPTDVNGAFDSLARQRRPVPRLQRFYVAVGSRADAFPHDRKGPVPPESLGRLSGRRYGSRRRVTAGRL